MWVIIPPIVAMLSTKFKFDAARVYPSLKALFVLEGGFPARPCSSLRGPKLSSGPVLACLFRFFIVYRYSNLCVCACLHETLFVKNMWLQWSLVIKVAASRSAYLEEVYLVTALVPSDTACLASSPGRRRRTAV